MTKIIIASILTVTILVMTLLLGHNKLFFITETILAPASMIASAVTSWMIIRFSLQAPTL